MSLESKAKTAYEIYSDQRQHYDMNTKQTYEELVVSGQSKWVPFEDVQRLIETAKTIMQEIPAYKFNALGWEMYDRKEIDEWCNRLYAVLKEASLGKHQSETEVKKDA